MTKQEFLQHLKIFVQTLKEEISTNDEWTVRGFFEEFLSPKTQKHFYHIGAKEINRNSITEAVLINY